MKNSLFLLSLMALPTIAFAGGAGNLSLYNAANTTAVQTSGSNLSTENPLSIIESRNVTGTNTGNTDLLRYSFDYIPRSFWADYNDLEDINGSIEAEEYFGETRRTDFAESGESLERANEQQDRAVNKAQRLRFIGQ